MRYLFAIALVLLPACKSGGSQRPEAKASRELRAAPMLPAMRAHLDSTGSGGSLTPASMPQHQVRVRDFVRATKADMQQLGMHSDRAYEALTDSVLRGLERLASLGASDVERLTAEHVERVRRLASVYERMVTTAN